MAKIKTLADVALKIGLKPIKSFEKVALKGHAPRSQQLKMLKSALKEPKWGDFSDPGTGKSLTSYLYITMMVLTRKKVLVLMPPGLLTQYYDKLYEEIDFDSTGATCYVLNEPLKEREEIKQLWNDSKWPEVLMMSYQIFSKELQHVVNSRQYEVLVCDEAHTLKNPYSLTHKKVEFFLKSVDNRPRKKARLLAMTGSPMPTTPECAYGLISLLTPSRYRNKRMFNKTHIFRTKEYTKFKNLKYLSRSLYLKAARVLKSEVMSIRKPTIIPVDVSLTKPHLQIYKDLMKQRLIEIEDEVISAVEYQTLRRLAIQICSAPQAYTKQSITNNVLQAFEDLLDSLGVVKFSEEQKNFEEGTRTKVVVYAHYRETLKMLYEKFSDLNPALINGDTNTEKNKNKFINDPSCRMVIIQPQSGGAGLDGLQNVAHTAIFFEPVTGPGILDQCVARVLRSGQKNPVSVYLFKVNVSIYKRAVDTMLSRTKNLKLVVIKTGELLEELLNTL